jgi:hypothetical protein
MIDKEKQANGNFFLFNSIKKLDYNIVLQSKVGVSSMT